MSRRGFTIPETLMVLCLLGVLMALAFQSLGDARPDGQAVAQEVTAQLRAARQKAQTHQQRVALILPGNTARSVSLLEGSIVPRVTRTLRFDTQYPAARLIAAPGGLDVASKAWLGALADRPVVVFDSRGLACGTSVIGVAGAVPWRVTITAEGTVECARGPVADSGAAPAAPYPVRKELANTPPRIHKVDTTPDVAGNLLPANVEAIIPKGGHITLKCLARDPEDDPLFAEWTSDKGVFSCQGWEPMTFDGTWWVSTAQFKPFAELATDTRLNIRVSVRDDEGLKAAAGVDTVVTASIGMGGKLAFWGRREGQGEDSPVGLWTCAPEGHNVRQVLGDVQTYARVSWDGTKIVTGGPNRGVTICNLDGSDETPMFPTTYGFGVISPNGKSIAAFKMEQNDNNDLLLPPFYRQILPWAGHWYPTAIQFMTSNGVYTKRIPVPFDPLVPRLTLPDLVWSADGNAVFVITYTQEEGVIKQPQVLAIRLRDETVHAVDWPEHLMLRLHASITPREVRATGNRTLEAIRWKDDYSEHQVLTLREWKDGGRFQTPAAFSPFDGLSTILCGRQIDGDAYSRIVLALWPKGAEQAHPLNQRYVEPFNDVITWTR